MKKLLIWCILFFVAFSTTACANLMNELGYGGPDGQGTTGAGGRVEATSYSTAEAVTERVTAATVEATTTAAATEAVTTEATETVTEATTENQSTESITAGCDHKHTQGVDEPTCETGGYEGKVICKDCGAVLEEGKKVDALGHKFDGEYVGYDGPNDVEKVWCSYGCGAKITREIPDLQVRVKPLEDGFIFIITGGLHPEAKVYVDGIEMKASHISHSRYEYSGFVTYEDLDGKGFEVRAYDVSDNRKTVVSYTAEGEVIG